jgi:predicted amidophosphoribosyltransferase
MSNKLPWTLIDPVLHGFQYLTEKDIIYYHLEYYSSHGFNHSNNSFVLNYKKDIKFKGTNHWHYKNEAINDFANLIINTPFGNNRLLLSAPTSKCRDSEFFDSRNDEVLKIVNKKTGIPISFNLEIITDSDPALSRAGYRNPDDFRNLYRFIPFDDVPEIVYIVDDVITSGSHFVAWRDLIKEKHPNAEVRGIYLARAVNI